MNLLRTRVSHSFGLIAAGFMAPETGTSLGHQKESGLITLSAPRAEDTRAVCLKDVGQITCHDGTSFGLHRNDGVALDPSFGKLSL